MMGKRKSKSKGKTKGKSKGKGKGKSKSKGKGKSKTKGKGKSKGKGKGKSKSRSRGRRHDLIVATWNILNTDWLNSHTYPERRPALLDTIESIEADLLAMQEVDHRENQHEDIVEHLNTKGVEIKSFDAEMAEPEGISVLVRQGVGRTRRHERLHLGRGCAAQRVLIDVGRGDRRCRIFLVNTHLYWAHPETRSKQMRSILEWMSPVEDEADAVILVGDLNTYPLPYRKVIQHLLSAGYTDAYVAANGSSPSATFPLGSQSEEPSGVVLDGFWVKATGGRDSSSLVINEATLAGHVPNSSKDDVWPSDHLAIVVKLSLALYDTPPDGGAWSEGSDSGLSGGFLSGVFTSSSSSSSSGRSSKSSTSFSSSSGPQYG